MNFLEYFGGLGGSLVSLGSFLNEGPLQESSNSRFLSLLPRR